MSTRNEHRQRVVEPDLFYLIGFQRSGTTLLCHLLDKHPEVVCAEEPEISKRIVFQQFDLLKDTNFDSIKKSLDFYAVDHDQYLTLVEEYLKGNVDEGCFLEECYTLFDKKNAKCVGAKEVYDLTSFQYDYLRKLIAYHQENVKIVFIERDIKGVVSSFIKLGFFPPGKQKLHNFNLKLFAKRYIECLNYAYEVLPRNKTHFLSFEDMMNDPRDELKKIYSFLGVDSSHEVLEEVLNTPSKGIRVEYEGMRKERSRGWQSVLTEKQIAWLDKFYCKKRRRLLKE